MPSSSPFDPPDPSELPPSPVDDAARKDAARLIGRRLVLWGIPIAAVAVLCLALGVPWWLVTGGIVAFVAVILIEI
jgi:hypothetical protein